MDAGGWVMDAGTRQIYRVGRRDVRCGSARCLVVARQDLYGGKEQGRRPSAASTKRGRPPSAAAPPLWFPCSLPPQRSRLATTRHLALPQRTSRLAKRQTRILTRAPRAPRPKCAAREARVLKRAPPAPRPKCAVRETRILTRASPRPRLKCAIRDF